MNRSRISTYTRGHEVLLKLLDEMWNGHRVQLYNDPDLPSSELEQEFGSVFLAGPTSRHQILECNWRCQAVHYLRKAGFKGFIYVPEPRGKEESGDFTERSYIHFWESTRLLRAKYKAFWIPRKSDELLGLNTNFEFGYILGKLSTASQEEKEATVFAGWPSNAERMGLPHHYMHELEKHGVYPTLLQLCEAIAKEQRGTVAQN